MALFCVQCKNVGEKLVDVKEKGLKPINTAAIARGVEDHFPVGSMVHEDCRRNYVSQKNIQQWKKSKKNLMIDAVAVLMWSELVHFHHPTKKLVSFVA